MTHDDDRASDEVRRALAGYRPPPPMPAEEMWAVIQQGLASPDHGVIPLSPWTRRIRPRLVTALAASLALFIAGTGVGFGVARARDDGTAQRRADAGTAESPVLYRVTWF